METAKTRLLTAGKSAIEEAIRDGLISPQTGAKTADAMDSQLDEVVAKLLKSSQ